MKTSLRFIAASVLACLSIFIRGAESHGSEPPKVVLVGDSIRLGYQATVAKVLAGKAVVTGPKANGGDSANVLKNLATWVIQEQPRVVHLNCGIHDTKKFKKTGKFQVSPEQYAANLREMVTRIRAETKATILFATSTPILTDRAAKTRADRDYELSGESIAQFNAIARQVMTELNVPINDLHGVFADEPSREKAIVGDGVHFTAEGSAKLGEAVAGFVQRYLEKSE